MRDEARQGKTVSCLVTILVAAVLAPNGTATAVKVTPVVPVGCRVVVRVRPVRPLRGLRGELYGWRRS